MTFLEVGNSSCLPGSNGGECSSAVKGVHALDSLSEWKKGVVLDLVVVDLDRSNVVSCQHASVKDEDDAVRPALGPTRCKLALGEVLHPGPFPVDDQERAWFSHEADLLLDLTSSRGARWLIRLCHTAWPTPPIGSVGMPQHEQTSVDIEEHRASALLLSRQRPARERFLLTRLVHDRDGTGQSQAASDSGSGSGWGDERGGKAASHGDARLSACLDAVLIRGLHGNTGVSSWASTELG